ncbi:MAG TPA: ATP-binding protein [Steroidobacteraceae bacterium]
MGSYSKCPQGLIHSQGMRVTPCIDLRRDPMVVVLDPRGYVASWHVGARAIMGHEAHEIIGAHVSRLYPAQAVEDGWPQLELKVAAVQGRFESEGWRVRQDGSRFWARILLMALRDSGGELCGFGNLIRELPRPRGTQGVDSVDLSMGERIRALGANRDAPVRKQREQMQRESARLVHEMAAATPDIIHVFALDEQRRICGNLSLSEVLGYESTSGEDEVAWADRVRHPEDRERGIAYRHSLHDLEDQVVAELECRFRRADGSWGWYRARNAVFARHADGSVRHVVGTVTEITALKRAENELLRLNAEIEQRVAARTEDLSRANQELESFACSVSHDLRAPLRAINGYSHMLLERCSAQLDAEGKRYLERVHAAAQRMGEFIDALLTLSRATCSQASPQRVNLSVLARSVMTELARSEPHRNVDIVIAEDVTATGDPVLLRIALENLLGNAWKFTSQHERSRIEFGVENPQHGPTFFVRDNGVGFDMEHSARLFAPFQRLHTAEEFTGTGIGLATVQRIIARHDGRIWAESVRGRGASFYFTLDGRPFIRSASLGGSTQCDH